MKESLAIKSRRKFKILAGVLFLLFVGTLPASADPGDHEKVPQASVIKTTPDVLRYENMFIGVPKSATLTITNVSDSDISITPYIDFGSQYSSFLTNSLKICDSGKCIPVSATTRTTIPKNGNQQLIITITMIAQLPENLSSISVADGLQVTGEVRSDKNDSIEIIPKNRTNGETFGSGAIATAFNIMGILGLISILVYGLLAWIRKNKTKENV